MLGPEDIIPVDFKVLQSKDLFVDEAALDGAADASLECCAFFYRYVPPLHGHAASCKIKLAFTGVPIMMRCTGRVRGLRHTVLDLSMGDAQSNDSQTSLCMVVNVFVTALSKECC